MSKEDIITNNQENTIKYTLDINIGEEIKNFDVEHKMNDYIGVQKINFGYTL